MNDICDGLYPISIPTLAIDLLDVPASEEVHYVANILHKFPHTRQLLLFNPHDSQHDLMKELQLADLPDLEYLCLAGKGDRAHRGVSCVLLLQQLIGLREKMPKLATLRVEDSLVPIETEAHLDAGVNALRKFVPELEWCI
jgi:hypothetical protein